MYKWCKNNLQFTQEQMG